MKPSSYVILNAKLDELAKEDKARLLEYLPDEEKENLQKHPSSKLGISLKDFSSEFFLQEVHYSWFLPTLKMYPKEEVSLFFQALPKASSLNLAKKLRIDMEEVALKSEAKSFLKLILQVSLLGEEESILPIEYLPKDPINSLITLEKRKLVNFIDALSLYDLSIEVRQIVDTKILKQINSILSQDQKQFLAKIRSHKKSAGFQRIGLANWDGNKESLKHLLHRRGLQRLGIALSKQHPDLLWYVSHRLDIGRGGALLKAAEKKVLANVSDDMLESVREALKEFVS